MNAVVLYFLLLRATALSFSGFASVPVIREDLVVTRGVLTDEELNSAIAISQASPGPLGLYVVVLGYFVAGVPGALAGALALAIAGHSRDPHRSGGAAPSGLASPRRLLGDRHSVVRADGNNNRALGAGGGAERSVCAAGGRCIHCACFRSRAAGRCDHRVGLPGAVLDVEAHRRTSRSTRTSAAQELCRNCVRSPRNRRQISTFTGSHRDAFCGGKSLNRLREETIQYLSVSVAGIVFQACSFNHSDISPS